MTATPSPSSNDNVRSTEPLGNVLVLGFGSSGSTVARYLAARLGQRASSVTLVDSRSGREAEAAELTGLGVNVVTGTSEVEGNYDLAVASPGIAPRAPLFVSASQHACELIGEPEFAWSESPSRWLAVTGTNGKTTTTTLLNALLTEAGMPSRPVGNIGTVATSALDDRGNSEWFAAELSSFQLAGSHRLHPVAAVVLNVSPDHLSWHGSMEEYALAKERVFANMDEHDLAVVNIDDPVVAAMGKRAAERGVPVCELSCKVEPSVPNAAFRRGGRLIVRLNGSETELVAEADLLIPGEHNIQNALAASALALFAGAEANAVRRGLLGFAPLEHRIEPCGTASGVRFVNDSKATDTDAVEKAVGSFEKGSVILLAGGHDKGTELEDFARAVVPFTKAVVCFGDAGERFFAAFAEAGAQVIHAEHLADALSAGISLASSGDVVLLSPACSSFDEFSGFEERGRVFKQLVSAHIAQVEGARA